MNINISMIDDSNNVIIMISVSQKAREDCRAVLLAGRQRSVEHQRLRGRGDSRHGLAERGVGVRDHLEHLRLPLGLPGLLQPRQLLLGLPEAGLRGRGRFCST